MHFYNLMWKGMLRKIILTIVLFATVLVNTSDTETEASLKSNQDGNSFRRVEKDDAVAKGFRLKI